MRWPFECVDAVGAEAAQSFQVTVSREGFADRLRYGRCEKNLVDSEARIELLWNRYTDFSLFKACGFDRRGVQAPVTLDDRDELPANSPYRDGYGR